MTNRFELRNREPGPIRRHLEATGQKVGSDRPSFRVRLYRLTLLSLYGFAFAVVASLVIAVLFALVSTGATILSGAAALISLIGIIWGIAVLSASPIIFEILVHGGDQAINSIRNLPRLLREQREERRRIERRQRAVQRERRAQTFAYAPARRLLRGVYVGGVWFPHETLDPLRRNRE